MKLLDGTLLCAGALARKRPGSKGSWRLAACFALLLPHVEAKPGADIPWVTIEAEEMRTTGIVLGPDYASNRLETESSHQRCVRLARRGEFVEFDSPAAFDALVIRYNLPDSPTGGGTSSELTLSVGGRVGATLHLTSRNAWLYGTYPFSNDPRQGKPRNFYDEVRLRDLTIRAGERVRVEKTSDDGVPCVIDLVDLEQIPAAVKPPVGARSVFDYGANGRGEQDDTAALRACIADVAKRGGVVWVPPGDYQITGDIVVPSAVTIQGAGMWHTRFIGNAGEYGNASRRVRFKLTGHDVRIADFAIVGALNYRNDQEPNDGIVVAECTDARVSRIWVEHTKAGVWVYNGTRLVVEGCRFRNLLADGVNFCVGTNHSVIENCTTRGTGDDCFAIWPAAADQAHDESTPKPGANVIRHSTGQLPFLANGGSMYGGAGNRIEDSLFTDITTGCGVLISSTFPTADEQRGIDNNFSGETVVKDCELVRCGGYDHSWTWRGALQICMDRKSITGVTLSRVAIRDSLSGGITIFAPGRAHGAGDLNDAKLEEVTVNGVGLGQRGARELVIDVGAAGSLRLLRTHLDDISNESKDFVVTTESRH